MKKFSLLVVLLLMLASVAGASAHNSRQRSSRRPSRPTTNQQTPNCPHGSTQARVQRDINDPWKQEMTIPVGQPFRTGSFHNQTGEFAWDTSMRVYGPLNRQAPANEVYDHAVSNGAEVGIYYPGRYELLVTTNGSHGAGCTERATIWVK